MNEYPCDIRITSTPEQAYQLLKDLSEDQELYDAVSNRDTIAQALAQYGIELSDEVIPPEEITLPSMEEIRKSLDEFGYEEAIMPYGAFRPPWFLPPGAWHSATIGFVFTAISSRAQPPAAS